MKINTRESKIVEEKYGYFEIDGEEFFDYKTGEASGSDIFDTSKTGMSFYNDLLNDPKYMEEEKNLKAEIVMMSPSTYFEECAKIFDSTFDRQVAQTKADKDTIDHLVNVITKAKRKFPLTFLSYAENTQEGRHRMYVAAMLTSWNTKFPVMVINWADEERQRDKVLRKRIANIEYSLGSVASEVLLYHYANYDELETQVQYEMDKRFGEGVNYDFKIGDNEFTITYDGVSKSFPTDWIKWREPEDDDWDYDDEDLYLMSDEELEDELRGVLKESIEKEDDPIDIYNKLTTEDIVNKIGVPTQDTIDTSSPMFLLPDGKIISVANALKAANMEYTASTVVHHDMIDVILEGIMYLQGEPIDYIDDYIARHRSEADLDRLTVKLGWARLNCGTIAVEDRFYCVLPPKTTRHQFYTLDEWIEWGQGKKPDLLVFVLKGYSQADRHTYQLFHRNSFASMSTEDIIRSLKRYYSSGKFYESLNKDGIDKSKLKEMVLTQSTPYMMRNDGEVLPCGTYHPYLKNFNDEDDAEEMVSALLDNPRDILWFYDNTKNPKLKRAIEIIVKNAQEVDELADEIEPDDLDGDFDYINYENAPEAAYEEIVTLFHQANDMANEEFLRVRTSGLVDGGTGNGIYFRVGSNNTNWFNHIWKMVYENRRWINDVTIVTDHQVKGKTDYYIHAGKVFDRIPTEEFIMISGNPDIS